MKFSEVWSGLGRDFREGSRNRAGAALHDLQ